MSIQRKSIVTASLILALFGMERLTSRVMDNRQEERINAEVKQRIEGYWATVGDSIYPMYIMERVESNTDSVVNLTLDVGELQQTVEALGEINP